MGDAELFDPERYLAQRHPGVLVRETVLPGSLQGCIDRSRDIIWLAVGLSPVERRSTLAYEVAQYESGPAPADPCWAAARRRAAEEWAARKLIPIERLTAAFVQRWRLSEIAVLLQVDTPTLRARMRGLTDEEQDRLMWETRGVRQLA